MLGLLLPALLTPAHANERRFTHTYETDVLPQGAIEIEPWTTMTPGPLGLSFANRLEFEVGLTDRLQTAWYFNSASPAGGGFEFAGVSSEWKYNLLSRAVNPVGLALYAELGLGGQEIELEGKVLLDKELGKTVLAYNLVGELELEGEVEDGEIEEWEREGKIENVLGASTRVGKAFTLGAEFENGLEFHGGLEGVSFAVGPAAGYGTPEWWAAATALYAIGAIEDGAFEASTEEAIEIRVLFGINL